MEFNDIPEPQSIRLAGEDSNVDISQEIDFVIQDRVRQVGRRLKMSPEAQQVLQKKLTTVPHRTYLWLYLVMDELEHSLRKTTRAILQTTNSLPSTVEDAYEKILGRLRKSQRRDAEILLHLVVSARRPLTLSEMDVAFQLATDAPKAQNHGDLELDEDRLKSEIRQVCGLFVFINDGRIHLIHQTAKEFLVAQDGVSVSADKWKSSLCTQRSESIMTQVCVRYLFFKDIQSSDVHFEKGLPETGAQKYPLLTYAAKHWPAHVRGVDPGDEATQKLIYELYDTDEAKFKFSLSILEPTDYGVGSKSGMQGVHVAVLNAHQLVLSKLLLKDEGSIEAKDERGRTPLFLACQVGDPEIVRMLLDKGADVEAASTYGRSLVLASCRGFLSIVQMLLEKGAIVNARGSGRCATALEAASNLGRLDVVRMLLDNGADVNARGKLGTAFQAASSKGHLTIMQMLLDEGADSSK